MKSHKQSFWAAGIVVFSLAIPCGGIFAAEKAKDLNLFRADPSLEACIKSVNSIGASMGHVARPGTEGKPVLDFIVRSNGAEYRVACEMATGLVTDVSPNVSYSGAMN